MPTENNEPKVIDLGEVTGEELLISGYEALKDVLAASVAQILGAEPLQAKAIYSQIHNDVDIARAQFIVAMREAAEEAAAAIQAEEVVEGEVVIDPDGFEYDNVIEFPSGQ